MQKFNAKVVEVIEKEGEKTYLVPVNRGGYKRNFNLCGLYKKETEPYEYVKVILKPLETVFIDDTTSVREVRLKQPRFGHKVGDVLKVELNSLRRFKSNYWVKYTK
jgi:hypothetical protein